MTAKRHTDGRLIIMENEMYVTNEHGILVRRLEQVLEDGTQIIQDQPIEQPTATAYPTYASAPTEEEINIPIVQATSIPQSYATNTIPTGSHQGLQTSSGSVAVVTGPPQPPRVAVVTGAPRPPPQPYTPSSRYVYRDERTGACMICGLSALVCFLICCCCLLPLIILPIVWVQVWNDPYDDDYWHNWEDDHV